MRSRLEPAALTCCLLANLHRDPEKRETPYAVSDFLPGSGDGGDSEKNDDSMQAFVEAIERGEPIEQTPEELEKFKRMMDGYLKPAADCGKTTIVGPHGRPEKA